MMRDSTTPRSGSKSDRYRSRPRADLDSPDLNHDARLTLGEFIRFVENSDDEMTAEDCQTAFDEIDTNGDGLVDSAQVLAWWNERAS